MVSFANAVKPEAFCELAATIVEPPIEGVQYYRRNARQPSLTVGLDHLAGEVFTSVRIHK